MFWGERIWYASYPRACRSAPGSRATARGISRSAAWRQRPPAGAFGWGADREATRVWRAHEDVSAWIAARKPLGAGLRAQSERRYRRALDVSGISGHWRPRSGRVGHVAMPLVTCFSRRAYTSVGGVRRTTWDDVVRQRGAGGCGQVVAGGHGLMLSRSRQGGGTLLLEFTPSRLALDQCAGRQRTGLLPSPLHGICPEVHAQLWRRALHLLSHLSPASGPRQIISDTSSRKGHHEPSTNAGASAGAGIGTSRGAEGVGLVSGRQLGARMQAMR